MIFTTYFAKLKSLPEDVVPIAICAKVPPAIDILRYKKLVPEYSAFKEYKETGDVDTFSDRYVTDVLKQLKPAQVVSELTDLAGGKDFALVCYERPGSFCHRELVADWLNDAGFVTKEFD